MSTALLKKAAFAKEASHEYQRQNILATAWKIKELRRQIDLMECFQVENKDRFDNALGQLEFVESFLLEDSLSEIRADHTSLLCAYQEDISGLAITNGEMDRLIERFSNKDHDGLDHLTGKLLDAGCAKEG